MRSEAQRRASRVNGSRSRGPTTPEGKSITRFNGLKHGLRAEHVVLPGEDPAAFEAERQAWQNDWRPASHTRAVLVERATIASWRLRRCVRVETGRLGEVVAEAIRNFDDDRLARVERTVDRFMDDPPTALATLRSDVAGIDRLLRGWRELAEALADGPAGWKEALFHQRLLCLTGHGPDTSCISAGPHGETSWRLLGINTRRPNVDPPKKGEPESLADDLRRVIAVSIAEHQERRATLPDLADDRRSAVAAALARDAEGGETRHRYEMAHDRALRAIVAQFLARSRSGADLGGDEGDRPMEPGSPCVESLSEPAESPSGPEVDGAGSQAGTCGDAKSCADERSEAPGSVGADEVGLIPSPVSAPDRPATAPDRAPRPAKRGGMRQ